MGKLFRDTRARILGVSLAAALVAFLAVGTSPFQKDALGQTPPPIPPVSFELDFVNGCIVFRFIIGPIGDVGPIVIERTLCLPFFFPGFGAVAGDGPTDSALDYTAPLMHRAFA